MTVPLGSRFSRRRDSFTALLVVGPGIVGLVGMPRAAHAEDAMPEEGHRPAQPAAPPSIATTPPVTVELDADDARATIERRVGTTSPSGLPLVETGLFTVGQWQHQCAAPCSVKLDPRYAYRVAGDGLVPSDSFVLPRAGERVRVDARMGSSAGRVVGALGIAGGAVATALGGLALVASPVLASEDVGSQGFRDAVVIGGATVAAVGVLAVGAGLYLWFANGSTARTEVASR